MDDALGAAFGAAAAIIEGEGFFAFCGFEDHVAAVGIEVGQAAEVHDPLTVAGAGGGLGLGAACHFLGSAFVIDLHQAGGHGVGFVGSEAVEFHLVSDAVQLVSRDL